MACENLMLLVRKRANSTHKLISDPEDSVFLEEDENSNDSNDQNSQHSSDQDIRDQNFNRVPRTKIEAPGYLRSVQQRSSIVSEPTSRDRNNHTIKRFKISRW